MQVAVTRVWNGWPVVVLENLFPSSNVLTCEGISVSRYTATQGWAYCWLWWDGHWLRGCIWLAAGHNGGLWDGVLAVAVAGGMECWVCGPDFSLVRQWPLSTLRLQLMCGLPTRAQLLSYVYTKAQFNSFSYLRDYFFLLKYNWYVTGMYMCPSDLLLWVTRYTEYWPNYITSLHSP